MEKGGMQTADEFCGNYYDVACSAGSMKYDVYFGEWSLATDACCMWLGGFNDANNERQFECQWVDCPFSYLPDDVAVDFDRSADILGPFGTWEPTEVSIQQGKCAKDSAHFSHKEIEKIARCALDAFDKCIQGSFFWTAQNELEERWDYIKSWDLGWINKTALPARSTYEPMARENTG